MKRSTIILLSVFVFLGILFWGGQRLHPGAQKNLEQEQRDTAIQFAIEEAKKIPRFNYWEEKNIHYVITVRVGEEPNLWIVDFNFENGPTDQGIHIKVDVKDKKIIEVNEDQA